jgi:phytol kinase
LTAAASLAAIGLWLLLVIATARFASRHWPNQRELGRKLVHIGSGLVLPIAWFSSMPQPLALAIALLATGGAALNHRFRLLPELEDVGRRSVGTIAYGLAITLLVASWWPQRADLVCAATLVMALGDGLAGLVGAGLPSPCWRIFGQTKSLLGTTVMALVSLLVLGLLLPQLAGFQLLAVAVAATLLEQLSWAGLDNLSVPLGVAVLASWLTT